MDYLHALDYLAHAYLQQARDDEAREIVQAAAALKPPFDGVNRIAAANHFARIPARYALERQDWAAAASLEPRVPAGFPWGDSFPEASATTHFARALGMAHEGRIDEANAEIAILDQIAEGGPRWARYLEVQSLTAQGWTLFLSGDAEGGLARMREAAVRMEKSARGRAPLAPGGPLPASELLGDMLLEHKKFEEAIAAYETALAHQPNRFNSLYGAGRAAELGGNRAAAADYYGRLVELSANAGDARSRVAHARGFSAP
jgi:tetratricopeptide (TPR) repeat protein